ncbi:MAG: Npt1/Npt2 family nucleotide transporter, partial [Candidatus Binatia bacterium]
MSDDERLKTLLPALSLGLLTAAFIIAKTGRDALFFQGRGLLQLPIAYIMMGTAALPLAMIFVKAMKIWGARPARVGVMVLAAAVMALSAPFLSPGDSALLFNIFIFIPASFGILFASLWLLATDIFEKTPKPEAARCFSKIGASSLGGGMAGGLIAKTLTPSLDPKWLVLLGALALLAVVALVLYIHSRFPTNIVKEDDQHKKPSIVTTFSNKYSRSLLLISMLGASAGLFIDFQFYAAATGAGMGSQGNASFFANFYILLNMSSLLLQLFAAHKIQDKIGLRGGLMILPVALIGGATFATAAATALSRSVLKVTEGGLRSSVHRSIWEQAFIPVDSGERSLVKIVVDGVGARIGEAIGATAVFFWLMKAVPDGMTAMQLDTNWMAWVTLIIVAAWLVITQRLRVQVREDFGETKRPPSTEVE